MQQTQVAPMPTGLLKPDASATYLAISQRTLWALTNEGKVKCVRPSPHSVRYRIEDLDAYITSLASQS